MRYGGFEMPFFRYAGFEFQKAGEKSGMQDWATPRETPPLVLASSNMFHHSLYRQHNSKIMYSNKIRLDRSCLNNQAILLEYNTLKGVYQV